MCQKQVDADMHNNSLLGPQPRHNRLALARLVHSCAGGPSTHAATTQPAKGLGHPDMVYEGIASTCMAWHDGAGRDGDALANTRHAEADDRVNPFDGDGHGSPRVEPRQRAMGGVE
jgi:hypothetical protein